MSSTESTALPFGHRPGQDASRAGLAEITDNATAEEQPWWQDFQGLLREGWYWRHAALISWEASPVQGRWPPTQLELAKQVLKMKTDRVIADWRKRYPIDQAVAKLAAAPLLRHRRDIYDALVTSATDPDPRSHPDRRMALEMLGDYTPRSKVKAEVDIDAEIGLMTVDEWREQRDRRQAEIAETMAAFEDATVDGTSAVPG